ncbi:MAG: hypothetical protein KF795_28690 [Labilithrix sp.]|nr:hypothetical protein [Labilithrix sp.]
MHRARVFLGSACFFALLAACVGGPGPLPDQGSDSAGQRSGASDDPSSGSGSSKDDGKPTTTTPKVPVVVSIATFDATCTQDKDCVAVFQGSSCQACKCPNAAINKKDQKKYESELEKASKDCPVPDIACGTCETQSVGCDPDTNRCALGVTSDEG